MATYVAGDIQGCYDQLRRLLDAAAFDPARDRLLCAGDLVNRGPRSLDTVRFLKNLGPAVKSVLGNHDLHFLAAASGAFTAGKMQHLRPLLDAPDGGELCAWMRHFPLALSEALDTAQGRVEFLLVHAGIVPGWDFAKTLACSREVEAALQGPDHREYLRLMYGDKPDAWSEALSGSERLRVITNILTRIRFCTPEGRLELTTKTEADTAPPGFQPWYELQPVRPGKQILFGHWAALDGHTQRADIHGLDTGCVWGRRLTMMRLEDGKRFSVGCQDLKR